MKQATSMPAIYAVRLRPPFWRQRLIAGLTFGIVLIWALSMTGIWTRDLVNEGGWTIAMRFVRASLHPELRADFLLLTLNAALITLAYAICGSVISVLLGAVGGLLSTQVWWQSMGQRAGWSGWIPYQIPWLTVRGCLALPRAIHEAIWGLFLVNIFGLDPLVALLAIGIPFGAITAKVFSEIIDDTPRQPYTALLHSGVRPFTAFCYTLLPQAFPNLLSYAFYRFECSIRAAAVLGIIGAGGLGYQLLLSLQSLRYEQIWTLIYALCIMNGLSDFLSGWVRRRLATSPTAHVAAGVAEGVISVPAASLSAGPAPTGSAPTGPLNEGTMRPRSDMLMRAVMAASVLVTLWAFWTVHIDWGRIFSVKSYTLFLAFASDVYPPNLDMSTLGNLFFLSAQTLAMSILAIVAAAAGGVLFSFPAAHNFLLPQGIVDTGGSRRQRQWIGYALLLLTRGILLLARAVPAPIWALVALFLFFPGILPGAIGLGIYTFGVLGRLMAEVVENLDSRPARALATQGASAPQLFFYGVLPAALPGFLTYALYRWEVCIRAIVIVGMVGAGGIGRLLTEQLSSFDYHNVSTTLLALVALTVVVDLLSTLIRQIKW